MFDRIINALDPWLTGFDNLLMDAIGYGLLVIWVATMVAFVALLVA